MNKCEYCDEPIWHSAKWMPLNLPDDLPWEDSWDDMVYHPSCFDEVISDYRQEIATKHGDG
jgi:hypothetical protein